MNKKEQIKFLEGILKNAYLGRIQCEISRRRLMTLTIVSHGKEQESLNSKYGDEIKKMEEFDGLIKVIKGLIKDIEEDSFKLE